MFDNYCVEIGRSWKKNDVGTGKLAGPLNEQFLQTLKLNFLSTGEVLLGIT